MAWNLAIVVSAFVCSCGIYLLWPSRYNIPAHINLSIFIPAYLVPCLFTDIYEKYPDEVGQMFAEIMMLGAGFYLIGLYAGKYIFPRFSFLYFSQLKRKSFDGISPVVVRRAYYWMLLSIALLLVSFAGMGFVPAFSENPFAAKFFRGAYQDSYQRVAVIYRLGWSIASMLIAVMLCAWLEMKKKRYLMVGLGGAFILLLALTRGPAATGVLITFVIYAMKKGRLWRFWGAVAILGSTCAGATFYYVITQVFGASRFLTGDSGANLAMLIANGSPDLDDNLSFLRNFQAYGEFTHGLTYFGGLIPGHFKWSPGVWTLSIMSPYSDVNTIISGGLRLPMPMHGYTGFGWAGVVGVSLAAGFLTGGFVRYMASYVDEKTSIINLCVISVLYMKVYEVFFNFTSVIYYKIPPMLVILMIILVAPAKNATSTTGGGASAEVAPAQ